MKSFLDTSVLVASFYGDHQHHDPSIDLFLRHEKSQACCGAHTLAEVYGTLTRMPGKDRVTPDEAMLFLGNVRERLTLIALTGNEYFQVMEAAAAAGIAGGSVYDAVLGHCALKAGAEKIYTWNMKHFKLLGPDIAARLATP